jgi:hypothetical protein
MRIIGVAGQAQMGKDTLADRLCAKLNEKDAHWKRSAFAAAVKQVFCETFDKDLEFVEKWKVIPENPPDFDMPVRQALQFIGDGFRKIKSEIWLDLAFRQKECPTIISDVRYVNEFTRIKKEGGLNIIIGRPDRLNNDSNGSEAQIRPYVDWLLNHYKNDQEVVINLRNIDWDIISRVEKIPPPDNIDLFDLFVCNCGSIEKLYHAVDKMVVPFCEKFVFDYFDLEK